MQDIIVKANCESDLYNHYSGTSELSTDLREYIELKQRRISLHQDMRIIIVTKQPVDEERMKQAFNDWYDEEFILLKREARINIMRQLWMFIIGAMFIAVSITIEKFVDKVAFTILSTIGAFAMWEMAGVWIIQNPRLRQRRRMLRQLRDKCTIEFHCKP